jgi:hypothetical protein
MNSTAELDKKFSALEARFLAYEKTLGEADSRRDKAQGLSGRVQGWQRDLDCLYLVWDRWNTDRKLLEENEDATKLPDARMRERRQMQLELQRDVEVPSVYFFSATFLDHIAQSVGYLFDDEDLRDHELLCRREILPRPMQERAVALQEQIGLYWRRRAQEYGQHRAGYNGAGANGSGVNGAGGNGTGVNQEDLTNLLHSVQTYAFGMAAFLEAALRHPALKLKKVGLFEAKQRRPLLLWVGGLVVIGLLVVVGMSWTCVPDSLNDLMDPGEMYPPLPAACQMTVEGPSDATVQAIESRREARGLIFQRRVTCRMPKKSAGSASLDNFYIDKTLQHGRQVFLAETQDVPGSGTLVVVESTLMPRWRYFMRLGGHCDAEL